MACSTIQLIPGPQGPAGTNGTNGTNGNNAYTTTTADFTMPAEGANVTVTVGNTDWMVSGQVLYVQGAGYMSVQSVPSSTSVALQNIESTSTRAYQSNVAPGTIIAGGARVAPGGIQGPTAFQFYALVQHQLPSGTNAGDFSSGDWRTVPLNTEVSDTGSDISVAANQVTCAAGTYRARWRVCGYQVNNFASRLRNFTLGTTIAVGSNATCGAADTVAGYSIGESRFTLSASTVVELQAQCQITNLGDGFGIANSFGEPEVYASLELQKEIS